jgi:hypothetical protein
MICYNHGIQVLSRWRNSRNTTLITPALFDCFNVKNCWVVFSNKSQISPDGSETSSSLILSTMKSMTIPISSQCFLSSSGARPVLPMVVAHEAIVESFSSIGSSILSSHLPSCIILLLISSGARLALPMVVAPEAIRGCLQPVIYSSISSSQLIFLEWWWTSFVFLYIFSLFPLSFGWNTKARNLIGLLVCKGPRKVSYQWGALACQGKP